MHARLPALFAALWWGSLSGIGFLAVPLAFAHLPSPAVAGLLGAKLFAGQTWVSIVCCVGLLMLSRPKGSVAPYQWARAAIIFIVLGLLLALLLQYGVAPRILARHNLALWHGLGTAMYVVQWACALVVLWHTVRPASPDRR